MEKEREIKLGFVVSEFHREITYQMEILGREHAEFLGTKSLVLYIRREALTYHLQ